MERMSLKLYLVSCDLLQPGDYNSLKNRLVSLSARQVMANQWALRSTYTAAQLKNLLGEFLDAKDRILVTEVGQEWASRRAFLSLAGL